MTIDISNPLNEFDAELWEQDSIHKIIGRAMGRPDAATFKFTPEMVRDSRPLWDWAEYVVDHYQGTFELMIDYRTKQRLGRPLNENQLKVALNTLLNVWRKSLKAQASPFDQPVDLSTIKAEVTVPLVAQVAQMPPKGTYTYVDAAGEYRTIRFEESDKGSMYIGIMYCADNTRFARVGAIRSNGGLVLWKGGFRGGEQVMQLSPTQRASIAEAVNFFCGFDKAAQLKAGEGYALASKRCFRCGRELTVPSSISEGMGPICAQSW